MGELADEDAVDVRLDVHDASRLEWSVSVPLPERGQAKYAIEVELEIPANVFARHLPWDQLQSWTRLDGPADAPRPGETPSIDALRRGAIAFAHKLARGSESFARHCRLAGAVSATAFTSDSLEQGLELWLAFAVSTAAEARERLAVCLPRDSIEIRRERKLVDEYVSVRLLEMLASAERSIAALRDSPNERVPTYEGALSRVEGALAWALEREVAHRDAEGWLHPEPRAPESLERYIERASRLKKHFQEVLFLEPEVYQVADRVRNWVAVLVALVASTWAFAWQVALASAHQRPTTESRVGSGIFVLAVVAGLVYAVKDRIKEVGRAWISGHVHRIYAQRVARWRAPARRIPGRDVVVRARESFDQCVVRQADALNPESGATVAATLVRYVHRGALFAKPELIRNGVRRVKHVFRYDLSPLFARLDDPVKQVPVLDAKTRKVVFTAAPRCYRVPVRVRVTFSGAAAERRRIGVTAAAVPVEENATLVLHKRGLDRLEFARSCDGGPSPRDTALETGVLPT